MRFLILLLMFFGLQSQAQNNFIINSKGDTLNRTDKNGLKQGRWVVKVPDLRGERGYEEEGEYVNGIKEGVWRRFSLQGDLIAIESFRYGYKDGRNIYFNWLGELEREESWRAIDPQNPYDTVNVYDVNDPNKVVGRRVIKVEPNSYKHGTWSYYNTQRGTIERTEEWVMDQPKRKPVDDDDLAPIDVVKGDSGEEAEEKAEKKPAAKTKPKEVLEFEKKNAGKKKVKVRTGSTGGG